MRYAIASLQLALAVALVLLWLRWNPFPHEHGALEGSPFTSASRFMASPRGPIEDGPAGIEHDCAVVVGSSAGGPIECIYEPGVPLRIWVVHPRVAEVWVGVDGARWAEAWRYSEPGEPGQGFIVDLEASKGVAQELSVHVPEQEPWTLRLRDASRLTACERSSHERASDQALALERRLALDELGEDALPEAKRLIDEVLAEDALSHAVELVLIASHHLTEKPGRPDLALELVDHYRAHAERYPRGRAAWSIYRGKVLAEQGRLAEAAAAYREGGRYAVRMHDAGLRIDALPQYARTLAALGYFDAAAYWGAESLRITREAVAEGNGHPADLADALSVVAEANVRLFEMGRPSEDPTRLLEEVLGMYARGGPLADPRETAQPRLALAELAMIRGRPGEALLHLEALHALDRLGTSPLNLEQKALSVDLELQAVLATSVVPPASLEERLAALERAAAVVSSPELRWRASVRRGAVLQARGDETGARAEYERSEVILDELLVLQRLGVGGVMAPERYREGTERLIDLLLGGEREDLEAAVCFARLAQSRSLRLALMASRSASRSGGLDELVQRHAQLKRDYEAWTRRIPELSSGNYEPALEERLRRKRELEQSALEIFTRAGHQSDLPRCDELPQREPGELLLVLHPHRGGLLMLVEDDGGASHHMLTGAPFTGPGPGGWSEAALLAPLAAQLDDARRVRVLASGAAAGIAVHAMPSRGKLLVERVPVVYELDLPRRDPARRRRSDPQASILVDPRVEGAWEEAEAVQTALLASGWSVRLTSATESQGLPAMLSEVGLAHYIGHAYYDAGGPMHPALGLRRGDDLMRHPWPPYPGGAAVEPSYIPLGLGVRIDVPTILMMESAPRVVFLSACDTGVHDDRMGHGGIGLAAAFLGAGAEVVVASTQAVEGAEAAIMSRGMYASGVSNSTIEDPGTWFTSGVRWAVEHGLPREAVRDYRVYVP